MIDDGFTMRDSFGELWIISTLLFILLLSRGTIYSFTLEGGGLQFGQSLLHIDGYGLEWDVQQAHITKCGGQVSRNIDHEVFINDLLNIKVRLHKLF